MTKDQQPAAPPLSAEIEPPTPREFLALLFDLHMPELSLASDDDTERITNMIASIEVFRDEVAFQARAQALEEYDAGEFRAAWKADVLVTAITDALERVPYDPMCPNICDDPQCILRRVLIQIAQPQPAERQS